jgi:hypothetical protein
MANITALPADLSSERYFLGVEKSATGRAWRDRLDARGVARATTITQRLGTPELLARVLATYRSAAARFPDSALIHIFIARFYAEWQGNRHMMLSHLSQAERRSPAIDLAFVILVTRGAYEADGRGGGGRRGPSGEGARSGCAAPPRFDRLRFDQLRFDQLRFDQLRSGFIRPLAARHSSDHSVTAV